MLMDCKKNECVLCHHLREDHAVDDKFDYGYCLKYTCNKYKEI
jgi:hypothetical protein